MALSTTILPVTGYAILTENTSSGITASSNVGIGTVVSIEYGNGYANLNDTVFYQNKDIAVFNSSGVSYQVVPFSKFLFIIQYTAPS